MTRPIPRPTVAALVGAVAFAWALGGASPVSAQDPDVSGVRLGLVYENEPRPALAVQPFTGSFGASNAASLIEGIIARDLDYSDRFVVLDSLPAGMVGRRVDYGLWDRLGASWLITGQVESVGDGLALTLDLHDVLYAQRREGGRFQLPDQDDADFRMAVHRVSDDVVEWITGDPGMAASSIAFTMTDGSDTKDIYVIDSDGEGLRRITFHRGIVLSPAWSPDAGRIAFTSYQTGLARLYLVDVGSGRETPVGAILGEGDYMTPTFHPNGRLLAFAVTGGASNGIFSYDVSRGCCVSSLSRNAHYDLSPSYSPDGGRMAFNTNRFGFHAPQIMVMSGDGGDAETLSPYEYGNAGFYTSPDWSPLGDLVAFQGRLKGEEFGQYQILVADLANDGRRLRQLTSEGKNEDPSWAPDGRHLAFVGERAWGFGLFVVDVVSGRIRPLVMGRRVGLPDWSPPIR